jgi:hypothetical protein
VRTITDDAYVWDTFFDPENPNEHSTQAEAEGDIWESLNKSAEEQLSGAHSYRLADPQRPVCTTQLTLIQCNRPRR